jgi:MFS family permease
LLSSLPYALTLVGAIAATVLAAFLTDLFGRRSAFALGGSLGLAGACLCAWSLARGQFIGLALGSFWLGTAQGFGLFYRHSAALCSTNKPRAIAVVLGAGCLAALTTPSLLNLAQSQAGPIATSVLLLFVGGAQLVTIALALSLPEGRVSAAKEPASSATDIGAYLLATAAGAAAWFGMSWLMAASPSMMALCGIDRSTASGLIAWHIVAMYVPAALVGLRMKPLQGRSTAAIGLSLLFGSIIIASTLAAPLGFAGILVLAGCGWSLAMLGTTIWVHEAGTPSRARLAFHDCALFSGAIAGALASGLFR